MLKANKHYVDLDNSRLEEQKKVMENIIKADHCPFCPQHLKKYHHKAILKTGRYWLLTENQWPYLHTKVHLLAIYHQHVEKLADLNIEAGKELFQLMQWAEKKYQIPGGALCLRFGRTDYSAGTVKHLHAQLIQPDIHHPDYLQEPVKLKIGKTKKN